MSKIKNSRRMNKCFSILKAHKSKPIFDEHFVYDNRIKKAMIKSGLSLKIKNMYDQMEKRLSLIERGLI